MDSRHRHGPPFRRYVPKTDVALRMLWVAAVRRQRRPVRPTPRSLAAYASQEARQCATSLLVHPAIAESGITGDAVETLVDVAELLPDALNEGTDVDAVP